MANSSLGEKCGVYLHGMPNAFAPKEQRSVPAFFWTDKQTGITPMATDTVLTHDAITPTLLKLFDVTADKVKDHRFLPVFFPNPPHTPFVLWAVGWGLLCRIYQINAYSLQVDPIELCSYTFWCENAVK